MERIISALKKLENMNLAYQLPTDRISELQEKIRQARVCTPIIGKFSSGKSALVNTVLGYTTQRRILKEDITPETAIPAEIVYTQEEDSVTIFNRDGSSKNISVDEYRNYEADASSVRCARIQLCNSFLEEIPDVMIVDMPGFESGYEIHNRAIDEYLPQSLAYIIAFPADDLIVRSSVGDILKELCLHDMPLCVAVTKYDKRNDDFDESFEKMKESLKRFVGNRKIKYCKTSSVDGEVEELKEFLREIQDNSQDILMRYFVNAVLAVANNTESYLTTTLNQSQLSESEFAENEEKLNKQLSDLNLKVGNEQDEFDAKIKDCVEEIKDDVSQALEVEESTLVMRVLNNQGIDEYLNTVVRNAVTVSVQKRLVPVIEKYLRKVSDCLNDDSIGDFQVSFSFNTDEISKGVVSSTVAAVAAVIVAGPLFGGIIAGLIKLVNKLQNENRREKAKQEIRKKLRSEVFPKLLKDVGIEVDMTITKQKMEIQKSVEEDLKRQRDTLKKAMEDVRKQWNEENEKKESLALNIKADLERIGEIKNDLR